MRDMTTWFCDAYASWQKGGIENANGRLRRWLPRNLDIDQLSDQDIQKIVLTANLTPRKCLGFKTPFQAILAELMEWPAPLLRRDRLGANWERGDKYHGNRGYRHRPGQEQLQPRRAG
jgi:IS30 family transposase